MNEQKHTDFVTPNDDGIMSETDSKSINNAIKTAKASGLGTVKIPAYNKRTGNNLWEITEAILLPSDITIVLEGCYIRQAEGSYDNVFRNENMYSEGFATIEKEQHNISVIGVGETIIDGWIHNGVTEKNSRKDGNPDIYVNNTILFHNIRDFRISGITIRNPRWWSVNLLFCEDGIVENMKIEAKDDVPNQDGIDVRAGCHNIIINNILGAGGDDLIAITGLLGGEERRGLIVPEKSCHIRNIVVKNIVGTSVTKAIVAIRNEDGVRMEDITVDTVHDTTELERAPRAYTALKIGHKAYVTKRHSQLGETTRLNVRNIHARCQTAIVIYETLTDSHISDVYLDKTVDVAITSDIPRERGGIDEGKPYLSTLGAAIRNTVIENIFCDSEDTKERAVIELRKAEDRDTVRNVVINNIFLGGRKNALDTDFKEGIVLGAIYK